MTNIEEIVRAVSALTPDELVRFRAWFDDFDADRFDEKIERDAKSGKLNRVADEAVINFRRVRT